MSNPANCSELFEQLSAYLDDELDGADKALVESHLANCADCTKQLQDLKLVAGALKGMKRVESKRELDFSFLEAGTAQTAVAEPCQEFIEALDAYHDNELSGEEKQRVSEHLKDCQPCNKRLEDIGRIVKAIKSMPVLKPPHDIVEKVQLPGGKSNVVAFPGKKKIAIFAAAAAAVALLAVANISNNGQSNPSVAVKNNEPTVAVAPAPDKASPAPETANNANPEQNAPELASVPTKEPVRAVDNKNNNNKNLVEPKPIKPIAPERQIQIAQQRVVEAPVAAADFADSQNELALMPDAGNSGADALGIGTDEDGLYDIKI